jgi:curli production assembly/transport component CsgF
MSKTGFRIACLVGTIGFLTPALTPVLATEQVYHPISPALGGNPTNGPFLLSTAQAQGEGVNSGNNGPTINFPNLTPTTPTTGGSQTGGANTGGASGSAANAQTRRELLAHPLGTNSGMP